MPQRSLLTLVLLGCAMASGSAEGVSGLLVVENAPPSGLVVARCDFSWLLRDAGAQLPALEGWLLPEETPVALQVVWEADFTPAHASGTVALQLPGAGHWEVRVAPKDVQSPRPLEEALVTTKHYAMSFAPGQPGGFPSSISFLDPGKQFSTFAWYDRLYDSAKGQFMLRNDRAASAELVSDGPLCSVVRVRAKYCREDGAVPESNPFAVYDWYLFREHPLAFVRAAFHQDSAAEWDETHFLELNFPDASFTHWAGGDPVRTGELTASAKTEELGNWGILLDGKTGLAMSGESIKCYDGRGGYGTYLNSAWRYEMAEADARFATWLWLGSAGDPAAAAREALTMHAQTARAILTRPELHARIAAERERAGELKGKERDTALWGATLALRLETQGELDTAERFLDGAWPEDCFSLRSGGLGLAVRKTGNEVRLLSLFDFSTGTELAAEHPAPLFELTFRKAGSTEGKAVSPLSAWRSAGIVARSETALELAWSDLESEELPGIGVTLVARGNAEPPIASPPAGGKEEDITFGAIHWSIAVHNTNAEWGVWEVKLAPLSVADLGPGASILTPRGSGEVRKGGWRKPFRYDGTYPSGWCSMQFMAAYRDDPALPATGVMMTALDPFGGVKDLEAQSDPATGTMRMTFDIPVEEMGAPARDVSLEYEISWQLLHGDWFDAARAYKTWVMANAKWWPALGKDGREDTPLWMRELCAWAQTAGSPAEVTEPVEAFATYLDVPTGFHWYCWHQIPFDNDYPHYFPEKEGMTGAVSAMQAANVFVMPYINGRLWDTHDGKTEDAEFTKTAFPAVTKQSGGKPFTETYGSREENGDKVELGVMCPWTALWREKQKEIVLKLLGEIGTKGVYMDQIAAASPVLCMDAAHGHPLGGGHWWNEGYWKMLGAIRAAKPDGSMLTTECNGEPFIHCFDGYLTWHWQYDGQVPAFPAIYGGAIQMFGRSYGGGTTRDLALRMRAAQQLVFGEQIGWLDPRVIAETENAEFFRKTVQMRWRLRRYFFAGEMARPPRPIGEMPAVRADWQWGGEMWVATDAVLCGAWRLPEEKRLAMIFANVSDEPIEMRLPFDSTQFNHVPSHVAVDVLQGREGIAGTFEADTGTEREITFPAREVFAWEIQY